MITFTELGSWGRLGNQLWQYALLKSISIKTGKKIILPKSVMNNEWHSQKCLLGDFNLSCDFVDVVNPKYLYQERFLRKYDPQVYTVPDETNFIGYFQSCGYLKDIRKELMTEFDLKDEIKNKAKSILSPLREKYKKVVSVHFRRGDLISLSQLGNSFIGDNGDLSEECELGKYINNATQHFNEDDTVYYVISGGSREGNNQEDIDWCKKNFKRKNVFYSEGVEDIVEFAILTQVDANICSHASSFGWWGSYLNPNQNVIAPKNPLIVDSIDENEYYPENWILI